MGEFKGFDKIYRWTREIIITEKIDGTNAQLLIERDPHSNGAGERTDDKTGVCVYVEKAAEFYTLRSGSRNRWITPEADNFGFAQWAFSNAQALVEALGEGQHFGEWWGAGIQRRYGQPGKRFSLFNVHRWGWLDVPEARADHPRLPDELRVVPVLYRGLNVPGAVEAAVDALATNGSVAAPGFSDPEGVVVFHVPSGFMFKKTIKKDEEPKGKGAAA